jgi:hypothetical protein
VQFANTRVAVPRRANGPDPEPPLGVHEHESSGDRREYPLMPQSAWCRQERGGSTTACGRGRENSWDVGGSHGAAKGRGVAILTVHTPPPSPIDMPRVFPQVTTFARTTIRLHPRKRSPTVEQSSVGGPLLWPVDEPWPTCDGDDVDDHLDSGAGIPLVPVVQLPRPELRWRRRVDVGGCLDAMPVPHEDADPEHVPDPCVIDPEKVIEYPTYDLPREVWSQISDAVKRVEKDTGWQYDTDLAVASGIKTGGYPGWTQSPNWPVCECGVRMELQ